MGKISIIFAGTSHFATPYLQGLLKDPAFEVLAVVTQPDKPAGRGQKVTAPAVKQMAEHHHIPVLQPKNAKEDFLAQAQSILGNKRPDFLVVVAYGQILPQAVLDIPSIAPINVHYSLLPRFRGASPIQHSILAGDTVTGVTLQRMVATLDAGPIIAQQEMIMDARDTFTTLHDRLAEVGVPLLLQTLKSPLKETPQSAQGMTMCRKLSRKDGMVDPSTMTATDIDRRVRGLTPWPGVTAEINKQPLKILGTSLEPVADAFALPCAKGSILYLVSVQPPGKKPMSGKAWAMGHAK